MPSTPNVDRKPRKCVRLAPRWGAYRGVPAVSIRNGRTQMGEKWDADPAANFRRRLGKSAHELGSMSGKRQLP